MRIWFGVGCLMVVAACEVTEPVEAKCKCFNSDGEKTGNCEFIAVGNSPAVFSFSGATSRAQSVPSGGFCVAKE